MEFRLLGELQVCAGGRSLEVGLPRQQAVLAVLLVDAGRPVPAATLIDRVWGDSPPVEARNVLYSHLSRIRRLLAEAAAAGAAPVRVERRPAGYVLRGEPDMVDLHRFRRLVTRAGDPGCAEAEQVAALAEGLGLWRGTPLAGIPGDWAAGVRDRCRQQRLDAAIRWAQAVLRAGDPDPLLGVLAELIAEHPLAEPLEGLLMRALHAAGREAEALDRYAGVRKRLVEELGVEPGAELRDLHQAILHRTLAAAPTAPRHPAVPEQLPADVRGFSGRDTELRELDALLVRPGERPSAVVISAVSGTAGVGKTALAVHWAHRVRKTFPDGQLYVNLRGYDPDQPLGPADALAGFLASLGVPDRDIPVELDDRAARYRTETAGRRLLVLVDNAASVEQVRPLLPGTASATVVVTSRDSLPGLVAVHGARRLDLDLLPLPDAVALLRTLIGPRVDADPQAAAVLAGQCARLPLALRVTAELAAARPATPLAELVGELSDEQRRLDLLDAGGDPRAAVGPVFSWSLRRLPADAARAFRLLGLHPAPDFEPHAAAALADTNLIHARLLLTTLARAHLVQPTNTGRFGMHDLLRAYATGLATTVDAEPERRAALDRLFDHYLATAATAMDALYPAESHHRPRRLPAAAPGLALADPDGARTWLDTERPTLTVVAAYTADHGWPAHTVRLAATLHRYLTGGHHAEALIIHGHAHRAARQTGDRAGEAHALHGLGTAYSHLGRYGSAADHLEQALARFRQTGDRHGEAHALTNLGIVDRLLGWYGPAADHLQQALALYRQVGDRYGEGHALNNLGLVDSRLGRHGPATDHLRQALALARQAGDRYGEAQALDNLGLVEQQLSRHQQAADHHRQALALSRQLGDRTGEAYALANLGAVHTHLGQPEQAADHHRQALTLFRASGDRDGQAWTLVALGETAQAAGRSTDALTHHADALTIATEIGARDQQAGAHTGLGHAHAALGDPVQARQHYELALALYTDLGTPEAGALRAHIAAIDPGPDTHR